jgi:GTP-binding protein
MAIVGAPSVGKSTVFNRMVGERRAIVEPTRGVTRDRLYAKGEWLTKEFTLIDTGGIQIKDAPFQEEIRAQVEIAIEEADLIVFLTDGKIGVTSDDRYIAKLLHASKKPVILAVNKIDNLESVPALGEFYRLGFGDPIAVSGAHGIGIGDLLDEAIKKLPEKEAPDYKGAIPFCLIGRPNVGKSSLSNRIIGKDRTIVSPISGTTRDSIDTEFEKDGKRYVCIDTAGLVKRGRIYESIDKYAAIRALSAIDRSDVAVLVLDAEEGIIEQDKHVVGYAVDAKKAIVIAVNKWDLGKTSPTARDDFVKSIKSGFKFLDYADVVFLSAKTGKGVDGLLPAVERAYESYHRRIPTSVLNKIVGDAAAMNPAPEFNHGRLKIMYASQVASAPPTFALFVNNPKFAHFSYTRYLENRLRESFDFSGSPINIVYRLRK